MNINLSLSVDEINAVLQTLGNLPTSSGAYPLMVKIKSQAETQLAEQSTASANDKPGSLD